MVHFLVTNIGNRNITYKDQIYSRELDKITFLEWTQIHLNCYQQHKEDLDINILNPLVDNVESKPDKIFLLYSDQSKLYTKTDQDTIHEAQIMKKLLVDKYQYLSDQIELVPIECKVIDNGQLMKRYRSFLLSLRKQNFDHLLICDAGGTAQQKMALKIMAEFLLHPETYTVRYTEHNQIVTDVSVDEYRAVINTEQAIELLSRGHFEAAADLLGFKTNESSNDFKIKVYISAMMWFNGFRSGAKTILQPIAKKIKSPLIQDLINDVNYSNNKDLEEIFEGQYITLIDRYYKTIFYLSVKRYSECIIAFATFYEKFLELTITYYSTEFEVGNRSYESSDQKSNLQNLINHWYPALIDHKASSSSLGSQVLLGKKVENKGVREICELLSPHFDYTDDVINHQRITNVRNKIAHEGLYISEHNFFKDYNYIFDLIEKVGLKLRLKKTNIYSELIQLIEQNLRS
jgi:hypothetical protein